MTPALRWIALAALVAAGLGGSYAVSQAFRDDARDAWKAEAAQTAQWLSGTLLGWLEESYAPLSGLAILFENSHDVEEVEFLGAADALEARATAYFIDAAAVVRPRTEDDPRWAVEFSNDPLGPLSPEIPLTDHPTILETVQVAAERPGQTILGPPFATLDGPRYSPATLATADARGPLVIVGLVNYDAIVQGLIDIRLVPKQQASTY